MRFLCDEMLARLARLLRAAGYDTYLAAGGEKDAALLHLAREEGRLLLTRDRRLAEAALPDSVRITGFGPGQEAKSLSRALVLDWDFAPFTRCVMDNAPLRPATLDEIDRIPPRAQALSGPFRACPACGRLYWPGSHVRRMADRFHKLGRPHS